MSVVVPPRPDLPLTGAITPQRPTSTWRWWEAILFYLLASIVSSVASLPIFALISDEDTATLVASAAIAVINVAILVFWVNRSHPTWREVIGWPKDPWPEVRSGFLYGLVLYPVIVFVVGVIIALLLQSVSGESVEAPEQIPSSMPAYGVIVSILYAVVIAPIHEELFFRGILYRTLADRYTFIVGGLGSGVAFGLIHYIPGEWQDSVLLMSVMVATGFALAWIYRRRGNLLAPIVAHTTFNAIGLTLLYSLR